MAMSIAIRFFAPIAPWSQNQERRMHWSWRAERQAAFKEATAMALRKFGTAELRADIDEAERVHIQIHILFSTNRRRDCHNFVSTVGKAVVDGIVMAGWIVDDSDEYVEAVEVGCRFDPEVNGPGMIELGIEPGWYDERKGILNAKQ